MTFSTNTLRFDRDIATSPDRLFHLLTDPKMREIWGAPGEGTVLSMDITDLREGGFERHFCGPKDAPEFEIETRWYRLNGPAAACFSESLVIGGERIFTSLVTYTLTPRDGKTALGVDVAITGFVEGEDMTQDVTDGWTSGLAKLEALAADETASA